MHTLAQIMYVYMSMYVIVTIQNLDAGQNYANPYLIYVLLQLNC